MTIPLQVQRGREILKARLTQISHPKIVNYDLIRTIFLQESILEFGGATKFKGIH